ncbi:hypothetical protein [Haladaptatus sp. NG-WS-4]
MDYWRLFELLERFQRAAIRASFSQGEFGPDHADVSEETVQYSQVVHATARAHGRRARATPARRSRQCAPVVRRRVGRRVATLSIA